MICSTENNSKYFNITIEDILAADRSFFYDDARELLRRINGQRSKISSFEDVLMCPPSSSFPYSAIVMEDEFHILVEVIAEGTESRVYRDLCYRCNKLAFYALKKFKETRTPDQPCAYERSFRIAHQVQSKRKSRLDLPFEIFRCGRFDYALHCLYDGCLWDVDYLTQTMPANFLLRILARTIEGLAALHEANLVARDFKGGNILYNHRTAVLTDLSTVTRETGKGKIPRGSYPWYDPEMFQSLVLQKQLGPASPSAVQTKRTDMFSVGKTIFRCGLDFLFKALATRTPYFNEIIAALEPACDTRYQSTVGFSDDELNELEAQHDGRTIFIQKGTFLTYKNSEQVLGFASPELVKESYTAALEILIESCQLHPDEALNIRTLINVGYKCLIKDDRYSVEQALRELKATLQTVKEIQDDENVPLQLVS